MPRRDQLNTVILSEYFDSSSNRRGEIGTGKKGYIPLYALNFIRKDQYAVSSGTQPIIDLLKEQGLDKLIEIFPKQRLYANMNDLKDKQRNILAQFKLDIDTWIKKPIAYESYPSGEAYTNSGLANLEYSLNSTVPIHHRIGSNKYVMHYGAMFHNSQYDYSTNTYILVPMYVLVVKKENVEILRKAILTGTDIPNNLVEMWVNPDFDTARASDSRWKSIRGWYIKTIKPKLIEKGIKIVERKDIMEMLFSRLEIPKFNTPREYKTWLADIANRFMVYKAKVSGIKRIVKDEVEQTITGLG